MESDQKMNIQQPNDLRVPFKDLKVHKKFMKDPRGVKRCLKSYIVLSSKKIYILLDDEYARYKGYTNRTNMIGPRIKCERHMVLTLLSLVVPHDCCRIVTSEAGHTFGCTTLFISVFLRGEKIQN